MLSLGILDADAGESPSRPFRDLVSPGRPSSLLRMSSLDMASAMAAFDSCHPEASSCPRAASRTRRLALTAIGAFASIWKASSIAR